MVLKVTEMLDMPPGVLRDDANATLYILTLAITPCLGSGFEHHMNGGTKTFSLEIIFRPTSSQKYLNDLLFLASVFFLAGFVSALDD